MTPLERIQKAYKQVRKAYKDMPNPYLKFECYEAQITLYRIERLLEHIQSEHP